MAGRPVRGESQPSAGGRLYERNEEWDARSRKGVLNGQSRPAYPYERRRGGDVECDRSEALLCPSAQFSIADRSSRLRRSGSARMSISTILPLPIVKPSTANGLPSRRRDTTPTLPF